MARHVCWRYSESSNFGVVEIHWVDSLLNCKWKVILVGQCDRIGAVDGRDRIAVDTLGKVDLSNRYLRH